MSAPGEGNPGTRVPEGTPVGDPPQDGPQGGRVGGMGQGSQGTTPTEKRPGYPRFYPRVIRGGPHSPTVPQGGAQGGLGDMNFSNSNQQLGAHKAIHKST